VTKVEVSYDQGMSWVEVSYLAAPVNRWAWQKWSPTLTLPSQGVRSFSLSLSPPPPPFHTPHFSNQHHIRILSSQGAAPRPRACIQ
jgi:hypothetical protein